MAIWANNDVIDNGPAYVKANCNKLALISTYTAGDSYSTVNGNILADVAMSSTDLVIATSGADRALTSASGKQDASANASGGGANMHFAFLDTATSKVLLVTEETSNQTIAAGNPVNFPSIVATFKAPVAS